MRYCDILLFIILFLHQTTTDTYKQIVRHGCLSSCSYIKPQQSQGARASVEGCLSSCSYIKPQLHNNKTTGISVVYHLVPTSNHNAPTALLNRSMLFIILFLHQTTTFCSVFVPPFCCLSSCSYIKPQRPRRRR